MTDNWDNWDFAMVSQALRSAEGHKRLTRDKGLDASPQDSPMTGRDLKLLVEGIDDNRVIVLEIKEGSTDASESQEEFAVRGVIRSASMRFKGARQVDGEDRDICIVTLVTSDF